MNIVGKFFFHCGKEYCQSGEVVEQVADDVVLVRIDRCEHIPSSLIALRTSEMMSTMVDGAPEGGWEFFATRADLDAYMEWIDGSSEDHQRDAGAMIN